MHKIIKHIFIFKILNNPSLLSTISENLKINHISDFPRWFFIILTHIILYIHSFFSISYSFIYNQTFGLMRNIEWIIFVCHHDGTNLSSGCIERPRIIHSIALRDHTQHRMKFFLNQVPYLTCKEGISKVSRILCTFFSFDIWEQSWQN